MENHKVVGGKIKSFTFDEIKVEDCTKGYHDDKPKKRRRIKGFANKSTVDRGSERVDPEAFKSTMSKYMQNPLVFYNHDWETPVGKVIDYDITSSGLEVEVEVATGYDAAEKVWKYIEQDLVKSFSIGFVPKKLEYSPKEDYVTIKELELLEVSIVTIPMNAESLFSITEKGLSSIFVDYEGQKMSYKQMVDLESRVFDSHDDSNILSLDNISVSDGVGAGPAISDESITINTKHIAEITREGDMTVIKYHTEPMSGDDSEGEKAVESSDTLLDLKATGLPGHMKSALRKGLKLHEEGRSGGGLQSQTVSEARQGISGGWSDDKIIRASAWFARHDSDKKPGWDKPGEETPGYVAWLLWGDSGSGSGRSWVDKKAEAIKEGRKSLEIDNDIRHLSLEFSTGICSECKGDDETVLCVAVHPSGKEEYNCSTCFIENSAWGSQFTEEMKKFKDVILDLNTRNNDLVEQLKKASSDTESKSKSIAAEIVKLTSAFIKGKL